MKYNIVGFAADHAGFSLKEELRAYLESKKISVIDFGTFSSDSCDYPDFAHALAKALINKQVEIGISICGTGNGINMAVNKHVGIRAALCWNSEISKFARTHNDANICALPSRYISLKEALEIVDVFLSTDFEGGRHLNRIIKIDII